MLRLETQRRSRGIDLPAFAGEHAIQHQNFVGVTGLPWLFQQRQILQNNLLLKLANMLGRWKRFVSAFNLCSIHDL
jgi:hypothetical protein